MSAEHLIPSLQGEAIRNSARDADRLATLRILGDGGSLNDPTSVSFSAQAIELLAARLLLTGGGDEVREASYEAFELLRAVIQNAEETGPLEGLTWARLRTRAVVFGFLADASSQARQLLLPLRWEEGFENWGDEVELAVHAAWQSLIRKRGWDDIDRVGRLVATLRERQEGREPPFLESSAPDRGAAWRLVACYHLLRAAEILKAFTESGSVDGHFDPIEQAEVHFDNASSAARDAGDPELDFIVGLLELLAKALVRSSIWTAARGAGARTGAFVKWLADRERERPILELLPPQRRALIDEGLLGSGRRSVVVSLPTSAGKTLVAEFRILQALDSYESVQGWVAYTAPTRALVNQITARLRRELSPLGVRVEKFSPALEVDSVEEEILSSSTVDPFRIVVTTPEKLDLLLRGGWIEGLGRPLTLVIVDEAHNLASGTRGLRLELLLASLNREAREASFLLLTPFIPNADDIARWLDADNYQSVELGLEWLPNDRVIGLAKLQPGPRRGDSRLLAETLLTSGPSLQAPDPIELAHGRPLNMTYSQLKAPSYLAAAAADALGGRGSTVTLVAQPGHSWSVAQRLANVMQPGDPNELVQAIRAVIRDEYGPDYPLVDLLERRVAVHHAGLSDDVRIMIEALGERGALQQIVATTTLAQGINFPISNVVLGSYKYPYGEEMPPEDFWNIAGRAGRVTQGEAGVVLLAAHTDERAAALSEYVLRAGRDLSSTLVGMVGSALERFGHLDLTRLTWYGDWSSFVQFITHTYRLVGEEAFAAQVEQVLRGTLGFRTLRSTQPQWADQLIEGVRTYAASLSGKPISLVDATGFSWESVSAALARMSESGLRGEVWSGDVLSAESPVLRDAIGVLLRVPELREQLVERLDPAEAQGDFLARVVKDWVAGRTISELATEYFSGTDQGAALNPTASMTRCCQRLFGSILPTVSWGLSALQALALAGQDPDTAPRGQSDLPSFVYYGVNTREAVALRLFGVPRGAANGLAASFGLDVPTEDLRRRLRESTEGQWRNALGDVGSAYYAAWRLVEPAA